MEANIIGAGIGPDTTIISSHHIVGTGEQHHGDFFIATASTHILISNGDAIGIQKSQFGIQIGVQVNGRIYNCRNREGIEVEIR